LKLHGILLVLLWIIRIYNNSIVAYKKQAIKKGTALYFLLTLVSSTGQALTLSRPLVEDPVFSGDGGGLG